MNSKFNLSDLVENEDIQNWSVALQYWLERTAQNLSSVNALEIGAGRGGLSLWAALNGMKVLCTDLQGTSKEAIEKHKKFGVSHLVEYEALNALSIPYSDKFDVVFFKSVLGGIGSFNNKANQVKAINEIYKSLKKGGELWFAENLKASPLHRFARRLLVERVNSWRYVTIPEMKEFLSVFSEVEYRTAGFLSVFGINSFQRSVLGKIDRIIADKLVPKSWRYIIIGVARK
jgi:ubiquinone/menaquinone biosynthesis C-methylase UbiE